MLVLENVELELGGRPVLRRIQVALNAGATEAVVGRNGAGKTTLLRAIMGLVALKSGRILLDGHEIQNEPAHRRAALGFGYAPEDRVILPTLTVRENLHLPCQVQGMRAVSLSARLDYVLHVVPQLRPMLDRSGASLSGGQAKMVALGRALMIGTRYVLLDEPFQGLAPLLAEQYGNSIKALRQSQPQLCVVVTESNAALLEGVQTRTLYLDRGALAGEASRAREARRDEEVPPLRAIG